MVDEEFLKSMDNISKVDFSKVKDKLLKDKQEENPLKNFQKIVGQAFDKKSLAEKIIEIQPCWYDPARNWWLWSWRYRRWERVDETEVINAVDRQAEINTINSKERNEILEALRQASRRNPPEEISPTWIQFKMWIIDIETGEKFIAEPKYFVTNPIPWDLEEENYDTSNMDRIFEEWVGKENVEKLYEILAYCTLPDYPLHRIFCFVGEGMNGKSKFLEVLRKFVGFSNCCSTELDTLISSRFEVTRLHKKLVCQMGETNFNEMCKTAKLKALSGGDYIGFEYKNKDLFESVNYAKLIIATNNLPPTTDKTIGFYRRWMIIDFPNQFTEKKDILSEIPDEEYKSLASRTVVTLRKLLKNREFTNEGSIDERKSKYEEKSNFLKTFCSQFVEESLNGYITVSDFNRKFKDWSKENRHREMSDQSVGIWLKKEGFIQQKRYMDWLFDGKGGQMRVWDGVKWKE